MKLYLVQHAKSKSREEDPDRNLSEVGIVNIKKTASYASANTYMKPEKILHSGKARAYQTAEFLNQSLHSPEGVSKSDGLNPNDDPAIWAGRLAESSDDLMLVGHLPHLEKLAAHLLCGDAGKRIVKFHNAGIVCLEKDDAGNWSVDWIITPELIK